MTVALDDLVESLKFKLNTPGDTIVLFNVDGFEDNWATALANGFWDAHQRGFYGDYRVDADAGTVINTAGGDDLSREDQQVIVLYTAREAVRTKFMTLFSHARDEGGGAVTERDRSSTLLKALLDSIDSELEDIRSEAVGNSRTTVLVIDSILQRSGLPPGWTGTTAPWIN